MQEINKRLSALFAKAKIEMVQFEAKKISIGRNNKTFEIVSGDTRYIYKEYFSHPNDPRDRLNSEYSFLNYAQKVAAKWTPKPISHDIEYGCALYEFIEGEPYLDESISATHVMEAAQFFVDLNVSRNRVLANNLPIASEACFSIMSHVDLIKKRVERLCQITPDSEVDRDALAFSGDLNCKANAISDNILREAKKLEIDVARELDLDFRCVSPSDFGFHNAIKTRNGLSKFIDFEYAGWDDPAKMTGDFFAQLAVPVPSKYFDEFTHKCMESFSDPRRHIERAYLLAPLYKIKWCCIALNVFLPVSLARRKFADPVLMETEFKNNQLARARNLLNTLEEV